MKRNAGPLIVLVLLLSGLWISCAMAATPPAIYVQPAADDAENLSERAVRLYKKDSSQYYLFLPSGYDAGDLRFIFSGTDRIVIDGARVKSGDTAPFLGRLVGQAVSLEYNDRAFTLTIMQSSNVPSLFLTTESGSIATVEKAKGNRESGSLVTLASDGSVTLSSRLDYIKMHGNGTLDYPKKSYEIKLVDKAKLYGMGKGRGWVLLANAKDNSLMRNKICYDLSRETGMQYAIQSAFVDLYINHQYRGNYLLTEKVTVGSKRVDIPDLQKATQAVNDKPLSSYKKFGVHSVKKNTVMGYQIPKDPQDITGGYLMEFELTYRYTRVGSGFVTKRGQPVVLKSPKYVSKAQVTYISQLMQQLEDCLFTKNGKNPTTGKYYYDYVDKDSLVMMCLLQEVVKNYDANRSSLYFYKPADSVSTRVFAGPGWDFDQALDNFGFTGPKVTTALSSSTWYHWLPHAYKIPDFQARLFELYSERFVPALAILLGESEPGKHLKSVEAYKEELAASAAMNYARWDYTVVSRSNKVGKDFDSSVAFILKFISERRVWLNRWWIEGKPL